VFGNKHYLHGLSHFMACSGWKWR